MDPLDQINLRPLMDISRGSPGMIIGMIDGPVDFSHPALRRSRIRTANDSQLVACRKANSIACMHGTFVAGIICAMRGLSAPAICPSCEVILYPIFPEEQLNSNGARSKIPSSTPEELSRAIVQTIEAGARIVNLSLGISSSSLIKCQGLKEAYDYTLKKGVIIIAVAGNRGNMGHVTILDHGWVIPVVACDTQGRIDPRSNFGRTIGKRGLMAPGMNITSTSPSGQYSRMDGTSVAAPFVTGTIALLWSMFPEAQAHKIISSLILYGNNHRTIIPPLLNANKAYQWLKQEFR